MEKILLITYNLDPHRNYMGFYGKIKELCPDNFHFFENSWAVRTDLTPTELSKELIPCMECGEKKNGIVNDGIAIFEYGGASDGMAGKSFWEWIKKDKDEHN